MQFEQIVLLNDVPLSANAKQELQQYSSHPLKNVSQEDLEALATADCLLTFVTTTIDERLLAASPNLRYIGLCGSNADKIDLETARKKGIAVTNVVDYGDIGVVEWIIGALINLARGLGPGQWKEQHVELMGKTIGILGLGTVGKLLAERCLALGMTVLHHSKKRKPVWEAKGVSYVEKRFLLEQSDIISLQTPRDLRILDKEDFSHMKGKILVNNTLGMAFSAEDAKAWITEAGNYLLMDQAPEESLREALIGEERVSIVDFISGLTNEATERLSESVIANIIAYLEGKPRNTIR